MHFDMKIVKSIFMHKFYNDFLSNLMKDFSHLNLFCKKQSYYWNFLLNTLYINSYLISNIALQLLPLEIDYGENLIY